MEKIKSAAEDIVTIDENSVVNTGNHPRLCFIEGDGIGPEITSASMKIWNAAVEKAYRGMKEIKWIEIFAGEKANKVYNKEIWLPEETIDAIKKYKIVVKGPLTTPVGGGIRSLNVTLRQTLDLYACVRPVKYFKGVPSPVKHPEKTDMVIFRENCEDIYAGIEWKAGSSDVKKVISFLKEEMKISNIRFPETSAIGIKPISKEGSERLIRAAIEFAIKNHRKSVTLVHKGNIMKFTEGGFREWGYELAKREYGNDITTDQKNSDSGKIIIKDCICDAFLQEILINPEGHDVVATTNLNGDYISDALAACVGGIGIAPGANINYKTGHAIFEATHGTAPNIAGKDMANPCSMTLSGEMMLRYIGWNEAADLIINAIEKTISSWKMTVDLANQAENATKLSCSEFTNEVIKNL